MRTKRIPHTALKAHELAQVFNEIIDLIGPAQWPELQVLAAEAGCSAQTLWNWVYGETYNPQINTLVKVARALGYEIGLRAIRKAQLRRVK